MPKSVDQMIAEARKEVREWTPEDLQKALQSNAPPLLVDVREPDEVAGGLIPGAQAIPRGFLEFKSAAALPDRGRPVVLYWAGGKRSVLAAQALKHLGYENPISLAGGFAAWKAAGGAVAMPAKGMTAEQNQRYSRHFMLKEVGREGQAKLLASRILMIGAGGLGSPAAYYLAAAGVGTLGIMDGDVVDFSNLQRQILHDTASVGRPKAESARDTIRRINPDVKVEAMVKRLDASNAVDLFRQYDLIVDGADNFATRYLVNDAAFFTKRPVVHGSIFQFEGQATVIAAHLGGPCYRCLYPEPPPADFAPNWEEAGVLGVLPGLVGLVQATEAVKLILGQGEPLVGRLMLYDSLKMKFREIRLRKDPACALCGRTPTIRGIEGNGAEPGGGACTIPRPAPAATPASAPAKAPAGSGGCCS